MSTKVRSAVSWVLTGVMLLSILVIGYWANATQEAEVAARYARDMQLRRAELIVQSSPVPTIMCGNKAVVTVVNPAIEMLFGYTEDELVGKPIDILIPEELRYDHNKVFDSARQKARARPEERYAMFRDGMRSVAVHKSGERIPIILSIRVIKYGDDVEFIANIRPILANDSPLRRILSHQHLETADPSYEPRESVGGFPLPEMRYPDARQVVPPRQAKP